MKGLPIPERSVPSDLILLRVPDLMRVTGLRQRALLDLRKRPDFPKPIMLTRQICAWRAVDIQRWQEEQIVKQQVNGGVTMTQETTTLTKQQQS